MLLKIAPDPVNGSINRFALGKELKMRLRQLYLFPAHFKKGLMLKFQRYFYDVQYRLIYLKRPVVDVPKAARYDSNQLTIDWIVVWTN